MQIAIVSNGLISDHELFSIKLAPFSQVIAADNGLRHLLAIERLPDFLIGDFDSISPKDLSKVASIPQQKFPADKDKSDTELAVDYALSLGAEKITLFGVLGGRTDHTLANLLLLTKYPDKLSIETERETLYAIHGFIKQTSWPGQRLSFFSLGDKAEGVTTRGLKWNLDSKTIDSRFFSLSNVVLEHEFEVSVKSGTLICVVTNV